MIPYAREIGAVVILAAMAGSGWLGWEWRDRSADVAIAEMRADAEKVIAEMAKAEADAQARARKAEQALVAEQADAGERADERDEQIERDYQRRIAAVVADRDQLRDLWRAKQATDRLADSAEAAAEADEQDRLRRASAARIVRAVERAQSERDEVIDRYEAVRKAIEGGN